jgi:hypothetical protein
MTSTKPIIEVFEHAGWKFSVQRDEHDVVVGMVPIKTAESSFKKLKTLDAIEQHQQNIENRKQNALLAFLEKR